MGSWTEPGLGGDALGGSPSPVITLQKKHEQLGHPVAPPPLAELGTDLSSQFFTICGGSRNVTPMNFGVYCIPFKCFRRLSTLSSIYKSQSIHTDALEGLPVKCGDPRRGTLSEGRQQTS